MLWSKDVSMVVQLKLTITHISLQQEINCYAIMFKVAALKWAHVFLNVVAPKLTTSPSLETGENYKWDINSEI